MDGRRGVEGAGIELIELVDPAAVLLLVRRRLAQAMNEALLGVRYDDQELDRLVLVYREARRLVAEGAPAPRAGGRPASPAGQGPDGPGTAELGVRGRRGAKYPLARVRVATPRLKVGVNP
jgi:hypothetical protein